MTPNDIKRANMLIERKKTAYEALEWINDEKMPKGFGEGVFGRNRLSTLSTGSNMTYAQIEQVMIKALRKAIDEYIDYINTELQSMGIEL